MKDFIDREMMARMITEIIVADIMSTYPATDKALDSDSTTEKNMAWIELHEDVLDEAYDMSKEYKEYKDDAN